MTKQSHDHFAWTAGQAVFPTTDYPSWIASAVPGFTGSFWAPDIAYFNNKYHLYYAVSTLGNQTSAIGLVTNPTLDTAAPDYQWTDQGPVIQSAPGYRYNAIDASIIQTPEGRVWMSFGSYWDGIYMMELDPSTGMRLSTRVTPTRVADNSSIEASYVYHHGDYHYLFVNYDTCCSGVDSTYNIRVARSTNVTGPFVDQDGVGMINSGGGTLFLGSEEQYIGPGHIGIFEDQGVDWFGYHYYDGNADGAPTYNLRTLLWSDDGWPIAGPSLSPADLNLDGAVDLTDYGILSNHMLQSAASHADGDMNGDGNVDYFDFNIWKSLYHGSAGAGANSASNVPEPSTLLLLAWGLAAGTIRWTRRPGLGGQIAQTWNLLRRRVTMDWCQLRRADPWPDLRSTNR